MSFRQRMSRLWWKVLRPAWVSIRWSVIGGAAVTALVFGYFGFDSYLETRGLTQPFWDKLYLSLQLFGLDSGAARPPVPALLQIARFLAPLVATYAAISAIAAVLRDQIAWSRVRWFARDHVVVSGLGETGRLLARGFRELGHRVVTIEKEPGANVIQECREQGIIVLIADPVERASLTRSRVERARYLFAVAEDDGVNAQVVLDAMDLVESRTRPLTCFVQILDAELAQLLDAEMAGRTTKSFRLEFFNPAERGAPALLHEYPPFDEHGQTQSGPPHLLVIGLGQMGGRLLLHASRLWRLKESATTALRVTAIDKAAPGKAELLVHRHPEVGKMCELVPLQMDVDSPAFERGAFLFEPPERPVTSVYVCLDNDAKGLTAGLRLRRVLQGRRVPIVVRTTQQGKVGSLLDDATGEYEELQVFGLLDLVCRPEVLLAGRTELLARAIHDEYVRAQKEAGESSQTNASMIEWDELPEHLRESNRHQADDIGAKLRAIGCVIAPLHEASGPFAFTSSEIGVLALMEHERWWKERASDGWIHAPEKDVLQKGSPYLVPWEELPEEIRELDRAAVGGIPGVLAKAGLRVARLRREGPATGTARDDFGYPIPQ